MDTVKTDAGSSTRQVIGIEILNHGPIPLEVTQLGIGLKGDKGYIWVTKEACYPLSFPIMLPPRGSGLALIDPVQLPWLMEPRATRRVVAVACVDAPGRIFRESLGRYEKRQVNAAVEKRRTEVAAQHLLR